MIEEVKKILESNYYSLHTSGKGFISPNSKYIAYIAQQICQLKDAECIKEKERAYKQGMADQYIECAKKDEARCQQKIEEIFREIEDEIIFLDIHKEIIELRGSASFLWQALKDKYKKESGK